MLYHKCARSCRNLRAFCLPPHARKRTRRALQDLDAFVNAPPQEKGGFLAAAMQVCAAPRTARGLYVTAPRRGQSYRKAAESANFRVDVVCRNLTQLDLFPGAAAAAAAAGLLQLTCPAQRPPSCACTVWKCCRTSPRRAPSQWMTARGRRTKRPAAPASRRRKRSAEAAARLSTAALTSCFAHRWCASA